LNHISGRSLPSWIPAALIAVSVLAAALWYLYPAPLEFPMDDTYIHFVYAQNLVESGHLMFNQPGEDGVGSTSLVWVLLLAGAYKLGLPLYITAKALGIAALIAAGVCLYQLMLPKAGWRLSLACSLLTAISGSMLWFALSGMETMLFLGIGLAALLLYRQGRWGWLGVALGLLALTRPEGLALAVVIGLLEVWRARRVPGGLLRAAALAALVCAPWFVYLYVRTGHWIPTSGLGKQLTNTLVLSFAMERLGVSPDLGRFPSLLYLPLWVIYLLEFVLGGASLPPPRITAELTSARIPYSLSIWALVGWGLALLPLLWMAFQQLRRTEAWQQWLTDQRSRPLLAMFLWAGLHNLTYSLVLPTLGTASRYGALNHILLWCGLTLFIFRFVNHNWFRWLCAGWLLITALANTLYWNGVYDANLAHMQQVRMRAARFVAEHLAADDLCAAVDIGALRFYAGAPLLDLGGLVDPDLVNVYTQGKVDQYLASRKVTCLVLPDRLAASGDGWLDLTGVIGLSSTPLFHLEEIAVYAIDRERWLEGYRPTMNYQATVTIYRLVYHE
jgi:hypothetical protein